MEDINRIYLSQCGIGNRTRSNVEVSVHGRHLWWRSFLLLFLIFTIFVGLPLLIMEFTVGKMGRTYTTHIYSKLTGKKWLNIIGWNGNLAVFILFGFYSVIGGWIIIYIGNVILQMLSIEKTTLTNINFEAIISNPWLTVLGQGFYLLTMIIVMLGVEKGLEKHSK